MEMLTTFYTDGSGFWSSQEWRKVSIESIFIDDEGGYDDLKVVFNTTSWDVKKLGFIYTDKLFLYQLRDFLVNKGLNRKFADQIDYSEQGMQGEDYVSFDYPYDDKEFLRAFNTLKLR